LIDRMRPLRNPCDTLQNAAHIERRNLLEVDSAPRKRGFGRTVLVVDDNVPIRKMLATTFLSEGFETCGQAANGTEAIELAQQIKPDLITMDFSMPGISGLVASSALRKIFPKVPIILLTLYASKILEVEAAKVGIDLVLLKTVPLSMLIDKAHALMD
jgi:CheY-like chemotaxis protein